MSRLLIQLLEEQKEMSNQIQQRKGVKSTAAAKRDNNTKAKANKGNHDQKKSSRPAYLVFFEFQPLCIQDWIEQQRSL